MREENTLRDLTNCEKLIMKVVWEAEGDISTPDTIEQLKVRFGKDYARTTVVTFVQRLIEKGYVTTYRKGRISYIHPVQSKKEYQGRLLRDTMNFWFDGNQEELVSALCRAKKFSKTEIEEIQSVLKES